MQSVGPVSPRLAFGKWLPAIQSWAMGGHNTAEMTNRRQLNNTVPKGVAQRARPPISMNSPPLEVGGSVFLASLYSHKHSNCAQLTRMDPLVGVQRGLLAESFHAQLALEWPLPSMRPDVHFQIWFAAKRRTTHLRGREVESVSVFQSRERQAKSADNKHTVHANGFIPECSFMCT